MSQEFRGSYWLIKELQCLGFTAEGLGFSRLSRRAKVWGLRGLGLRV